MATIKSLEEKVDVVRDSQIRMEVDLKEHMRRTDVLEKLHRDNQTRIESLEEPTKAKEYIMHVLADIGKFTGFILTILAILRYFSVI